MKKAHHSESNTPSGWQSISLRSACLQTGTWNPVRDHRERIRYIDVSSVSNEYFKVTEAQDISASEAPSRARKIVNTGDVIYATVRPSLKRVAMIDRDCDNQIVSTAFCVVRANPHDAVPKYLYFLLLTADMNSRIIEHERGASYPAVTDKDILNQMILLPPLPEQERIAGILSTIQDAIAAEADIIRNARDLKKSLLSHLFTHGLHNKPLKETLYGEVPECWPVQTLNECADIQTGIAKGRPVKHADAVEVPYLRVANVQAGHIDLSEIKTIQIRRDELPRYQLRKGDVVVTEGGDFDKLGRGFIWNGQIDPCIHQNHIFAMRPHHDKVSPDYLAYLIQSPYGRAYFLAVAHKTTNLACINTSKLKALPVPTPPLSEQEEIAAILQSVDAKIATHEAKQRSLQELFKTMLNELMMGGGESIALNAI